MKYTTCRIGPVLLIGLFLGAPLVFAQQADVQLVPQPPEPVPPAKPALPAKVDKAVPMPLDPGPALPPGTCRIELMDGSAILGRIATPEFILTTDFGTLKIPVAAVTGLAPGLDSRPAYKARLAQLIDDLTSGDAQRIARADPQLTHLGVEVVGELTAAMRQHKDDASQHAIQEVLDAIADAHEPGLGVAAVEAAPLRKEDTISTEKFSAVGRLEPRQLRVSANFGDVTIQLSELKRVTRAAVGGVPDQLVSTGVTIAQGVADSYKNTGLMIAVGDRLTFVAKGQIKMLPWDEGIVAGPEGESENCGFAGPGIPQGALVGRIGNGPSFKIGTRLTMVADRAGPLKIGIGIEPGMWSNFSQRIKNGEGADAIVPGKFDVRVLHQMKK